MRLHCGHLLQKVDIPANNVVTTVGSQDAMLTHMRKVICINTKLYIPSNTEVKVSILALPVIITGSISDMLPGQCVQKVSLGNSCVGKSSLSEICCVTFTGNTAGSFFIVIDVVHHLSKFLVRWWIYLEVRLIHTVLERVFICYQ